MLETYHWAPEAGSRAHGRGAGLEARHVGPLTFWKMDQHQRQAAVLPELLPPDNRDFLKIVLQLDGEVRVEKRGRTTVLTPGTLGLYGLSRTCNVFHIDPSSRQLVIVVPRDELASRNPGLSRIMQRQFSADSRTCALAFGFLTSLYESVEEDCAFRQELANVAIHLLQVALAEQVSAVSGRSDRERFHTRVTSYVDLHLHDPRLSVESIARALHCSSRYLQKVFDNEEESLSRYIWRTRIERCRAALADPANAGRSIIEIAFAQGFSNASHFSRAFRERFDVSPRDYRAAALRAGAA